MKKTVIITGASRGIGKAIALRMGKENYNVVVNFASREQCAQEVVDEIVKNGGSAALCKGDVSRVEDVEKLFQFTKDTYGEISTLVNNAGVLILGQLEGFRDEDFDKVFNINVKGVFNTLRCAAKMMSDNGKIINITSSAIGLSIPGYSIYNASKSAVESMSTTFSKELRGRKISVNCVAPGPTATDLFLDNKTDEQIEHFKKMSPLERLGEPEDIAHIVSFLASNDSSWVNSQVLRANGGIV